jgi:ADP-heptose:LPS heptosyltransferase
LPDFRSGVISAATQLAGLPWRLKPGRGKPVSLADPRLARIVVIKPCCMGDVLMATPAIAALRRALPNSHIAMVTAPWAQPAIANNPRIDRIITPPGGSGAEGHFSDARALASLVEKEHFGAAFVLDRSPLLNVASRLAGIPLRAGLDSDGRGVALTNPVDCPAGVARQEVEC